MESYLQQAAGDSVHSVSIQNVRRAIAATIEMDDEHGAFWVGMIEGEEEFVLETHKDLTMIGIFPDSTGPPLRARMPDWAEVERLYGLFLNQDYAAVKTILAKVGQFDQC